MGTLRRSVWIGLSVFFILSMASCSWLGIGGRLNPITTQKTALAITKLVRSQPFPEQYYESVTYDPEVVFDPNQLLGPLIHLRIKPGYTLDFVYHLNLDFGGGYATI